MGKSSSHCHSCMGTGKVLRMVGFDDDHYPRYASVRCPACNGSGEVDMTELFIVPRGMVKDEFFVSPLYTEDEQSKLRKILEEERKFLEKGR